MGNKKKSELTTRKKIYNFISSHPGMHERKISRELNIPMSTLDYHLHYLEKKELIVSKKEDRYNRYFVKGKVGIRDKKILSLLRKNSCRKILIFLLLNKECNHKTIRKHLGLAASTTSFHLKKLIRYKIIASIEQGRQTKYYVIDPEYVSKLIISYKKSFIDDAVDRFASTWLDLHPKHLQKKENNNNEKTKNLLLFLS